MSTSASISVAELAESIGGTLHGDGARRLTGVATLEAAGPDELAWLGDVRYLPQFEQTRAGAVLVPPNTPLTAGRTAIVVADPDLALCAALRRLSPALPTVATGVHPSANIEPGAHVEGAAIGPGVFVGARARIGAGTQLHAGVFVGEDSAIGRDCTLWPNVVVRERITIGDRVVIHPNATIGADGFSYLQRDGRHVKVPQVGTVLIEDDVEIGANTAIDRARSGATRIGRGTKIDNLAQIGHNAQIGEDCIIVAQCGISGSTVLGHHVVLGGQAGVIDHLHIAPGVQVAVRSLVMRDLEVAQTYMGYPAIESREFFRRHTWLGKLPGLADDLRALVKRVEQLESAADDREGS